MRTIRNRRTYNTETADLIGVYYYAGLSGRLHSYNPRYYRKPNGELFKVYNGRIFTDNDGPFSYIKDEIDRLKTINVVVNELPSYGRLKDTFPFYWNRE